MSQRKKSHTLTAYLAASLGALTLTSDLFANQTDAPLSMSSVSLDMLLNMKITVASGDANALTTRESPGVITVLTEQDIEATGASNLFQLLRFVPGFDVGADQNALIAPMIRGNFGSEGQVLINYDGIPITEAGYGSNSFGGHIALDRIKRIEIIRGPGSALYGGSAELAVINIISKNMAGDTRVKARSSKIIESQGFTTAELSTGKAWQDGTTWDLFLAHSQTDKTDQDYFGWDGAFLSPGDKFFEQENSYIQSNLQGEEFRWTLVYGDQDSHYPLSAWNENAQEWYLLTDVYGTVTYEQLSTELAYDFDLSEALLLTTKLFYSDVNSATHATEIHDTYPENYWKTPSQRTDANVNLNAKPFSSLDLSFDIGLGYIHDRASYSERQANSMREWWDIQRSPSSDNTYNAYSYLQALLKKRDFIFTVGARHEDHNIFGSITVPRISLSTIQGNFHGKILASRAFKSPTVLNLGITADLKPERVSTKELELGYRFTDNLISVVNFFDTKITDFVVYNDELVEYSNGGDLRTQGAEFEVRYQGDQGFLALNYGHTSIKEQNVEGLYPFYYDYNTQQYVTVSTDEVYGASPNKVSFYGAYELTDSITLMASMVYVGERNSIIYAEELGYAVSGRLLEDAIINVSAKKENLWADGLNATVSVTNLTDDDNTIPTGFYSDQVNTPQGIGRRLEVAVSYTF